jgi:polyhydroxyalkanoate synthesis regulator phasin
MSQIGQPQQGPQAPPIPFGKSDEIRLGQLQNALSQVAQMVGEGEWSPEEGQQMTAQIMQQLQPLLQRQQADQQQKTQQAHQQAMQDAAFQESIRTVHLQNRAQQFQQTVASFTDPVTGRVTHFYPDEKGNYKEVEAKQYHADQDRLHQHQQAMETALQPPEPMGGTSDA